MLSLLKKKSTKEIPACICGKILIQKKCSDCYGGSGVQCDGCGSSIAKRAWVYHCAGAKCAEHGAGYDLCAKCAYIAPVEASCFLTVPQEIMDGLSAADRGAYRYQENIPSGWCPKKGYKHALKGISGDRISSYSTYTSLSQYLTDYNRSKQFNAFNNLTDEQYNTYFPAQNVADSTSNTEYFYGTSNVVDGFPFVCLEKRGFNAKIGVLSKDEHIELKKKMNVLSKDVDTMDDYRKATVLGRGNGRIHDIVDPNKHLASLWVTDNNVFHNKNYQEWIPSIFRVNTDLNQCTLRSEIPNLNPYKYGNTLYPLIRNLFLKMFPMFENVYRHNLRDIDLGVIVKMQNYEMKQDDVYIGNVHCEGLFEDIVCGGIYYYDIDDEIEGGELEITSLINVRSERQGRTRTAKIKVEVNEGDALVFSNSIYHRVCKLFCNEDKSKRNAIYQRKIITFFLLPPSRSLYVPNPNTIVVNWKYHMIHIIKKWIIYDQILDVNSNLKWLFDIIGEYMIGEKVYVRNMVDRYRKCRKAWSYKKLRFTKSEIESDGIVFQNTTFTPYQRHACNLD